MSYDPPLPPNRPTAVRFELPADLRVDEPVEITVILHEPDDASFVGNCATLDPDVGDVEPGGSPSSEVQSLGCATPNLIESERYGPWDPPGQVSERYLIYEITYRTPGPHTVRYRGDDPGRCDGVPACPDRIVDHTFEVLP